jgi:Ca2+-transporting ATPase
MVSDPPTRAHACDASALAQSLAVDPSSGLSASEASRRLRAHGPNAIAEAPPRSAWRMLIGQFADFMILVLIAAGVIAGVIGEFHDTIAIIVIVVLNAAIGFVQEFRAERAIAALKTLATPSARVRRDGRVEVVASADLVPGDIVLLDAGSIVPADIRVVEAAQLKVNESVLTGEAEAAAKFTDTLPDADLSLADRRNMLYKGTTLSAGRATGIVIATGMNTELGGIARLLREQEPVRTPLQRRLAVFGRRLALVVLAICVLIFAAGLLRGEPPVLMFLTAISLAVAAIPEALPAVVTVTLAIGARNMVRRNALIRHLPAVETLGSVTYVCTDKTGTLTENRMRVTEVFVDGQVDATLTRPMPPLLLRALALNNDSSRGADGRLSGDPTEVALYELAETFGHDGRELAMKTPRCAELPFDAERAAMTTVHVERGRWTSYTKGAPERLLPRCTSRWTSSGPVPVDAGSLLAHAGRMASSGLRVLAVACREWRALPRSIDPETFESDLCFIGFVGLEDPPRAEAHDAVASCRQAGITPVMITGDHPSTALAIARRLGIAAAGDGAVTGNELESLSPQQLEALVLQARVYARVTPAQKNAIVQALQAQGHFVAMTGDGVNDAPALKAADIGVAMGRNGTDVAREAADMVLLDDNFATIVGAVREGRRIFDNIRKFIRYAMTGNSAEVWTLFLAPFLMLPLPLLPIHILWVNLVTDGLPGIALAMEPAERNLMHRRPRSPNESIFAHGMWQHMLWVGLLIAGVSLLAQAWAFHTGSAHWQTMVFTVLTLAQMGHVLAIRSETASLFTLGLRTNLPLLGTVLLTVALQMAVVYVPWLQPIFRTAPLSAGELLICLALSLVVFIAVEIEKLATRRGWLYVDESVRRPDTQR